MDGMVSFYEERFILIADESSLDDLTRKLMRIGLDNIQGYITGIEEWAAQGGYVEKVNQVSTSDLKEILNNNHTQIIDLRGAAEYKAGHIKGTENIFVGTLQKGFDKIKKDQQVIIHCHAGDRSTIAYSLLCQTWFQEYPELCWRVERMDKFKK